MVGVRSTSNRCKLAGVFIMNQTRELTPHQRPQDLGDEAMPPQALWLGGWGEVIALQSNNTTVLVYIKNLGVTMTKPELCCSGRRRKG